MGLAGDPHRNRPAHASRVPSQDLLRTVVSEAAFGNLDPWPPRILKARHKDLGGRTHGGVALNLQFEYPGRGRELHARWPSGRVAYVGTHEGPGAASP